jgi:hypothetical protein
VVGLDQPNSAIELSRPKKHERALAQAVIAGHMDLEVCTRRYKPETLEGVPGISLARNKKFIPIIILADESIRREMCSRHHQY